MSNSMEFFERLTKAKHELYMSNCINIDDVGELNELWLKGNLTEDRLVELEQWAFG